MSQHESFSKEQLSAFVDNQLDANERTRIISAAHHDKTLAEEIHTLQQYNELIQLAYNDVRPAKAYPDNRNRQPLTYRIAIAASIMLVCGLVIGWYLAKPLTTENPIQTLAQIDPTHLRDDKVLIHINVMDTTRIDYALNKTEEMLDIAAHKGKPLQVEVIVNADGINMLRAGSPYSNRIHSLTERYDNVSFLACGFAMENMRLKEGQEVNLIPEAKKVDAALEQILRRLKSGWLYLRS